MADGAPVSPTRRKTGPSLTAFFHYNSAPEATQFPAGVCEAPWRVLRLPGFALVKRQRACYPGWQKSFGKGDRSMSTTAHATQSEGAILARILGNGESPLPPGMARYL